MQLERFPITRGSRPQVAPRATAVLAFVALACTAALPASAATLDRIKETGHIKLGYLVDARPFTFRSETGGVEGYGAALCQHIADQVKTQLSLSDLSIDWVPVTGESRLSDVQQGNVDLMCTPAAVTLSRRQDVSFSIPVFPAGVRAVLRADAPTALRDALSETPSTKPVWRGSPAAKVLEKTTFAVVSGTTTEEWLKGGLKKFQIDAKVVTVPDFRSGLKQLQDGKAQVFFGDRAVVLGAMDGASSKDFLILDRMLTREPASFALARSDEDFRLLVDRTLSQLYPSTGFRDLYTKWIGKFDQGASTFFQWNTVEP
jgi:polar amino acid transport system substrate-binding protein